MKSLKRILVLSLFALSAFIPSTSLADMPGRHPHYLRALADLRDARAHLEHTRKHNEHPAIEEIDAAIREIRKASIDDGKNLADHPPVDVRLDGPGRIHHARELLLKAKSDVDKEEDNQFAAGLQMRALKHIRAAIELTR